MYPAYVAILPFKCPIVSYNHNYQHIFYEFNRKYDSGILNKIMLYNSGNIRDQKNIFYE